VANVTYDSNNLGPGILTSDGAETFAHCARARPEGLCDLVVYYRDLSCLLLIPLGKESSFHQSDSHRRKVVRRGGSGGNVIDTDERRDRSFELDRPRIGLSAQRQAVDHARALDAGEHLHSFEYSLAERRDLPVIIVFGSWDGQVDAQHALWTKTGIHTLELDPALLVLELPYTAIDEDAPVVVLLPLPLMVALAPQPVVVVSPVPLIHSDTTFAASELLLLPLTVRLE